MSVPCSGEVVWLSRARLQDGFCSSTGHWIIPGIAQEEMLGCGWAESQAPCSQAALFLSVHTEKWWRIKFSTVLHFPSAAWGGPCGSWVAVSIMPLQSEIIILFFFWCWDFFFLIATENFLHYIPELYKPLQPGHLDRWFWVKVVWKWCWMSLSWVSAAEVFRSLLPSAVSSERCRACSWII